MNKIPEIINDFNVYRDGNKLCGISGEISLPEFEATTETISGAGILGEYEATNPGQFGAQELEIPFRVLYGDIFDLMGQRSVKLTLRGAAQVDDGTGAKEIKGVRVIVQGEPKKLTGGTMQAGKPTSSSVTLALTYIKVEIDGSSALELDKKNHIYTVNGVDMLSAINSLI